MITYFNRSYKVESTVREKWIRQNWRPVIAEGEQSMGRNFEVMNSVNTNLNWGGLQC